LDTVAQLEEQRDVNLPAYLKALHNRIETLEKYSATSAEHARQASDLVFTLQNSVKAFEGQLKGLRDEQVMSTKRADEAKFKAAVAASPEGRAYSSAWDEIAAAEAKAKSRFREQYFHGMASTLANLAQQIVEYVAEIKKPDGTRLPGFHES